MADVEHVINRSEIRKITPDIAVELIQLGENCNLNYMVEELAEGTAEPVDAVTAALTNRTQFFIKNYREGATGLIGNVIFLVNIEYCQKNRLIYFLLVPQHLVGRDGRKRYQYRKTPSTLRSRNEPAGGYL